MRPNGSILATPTAILSLCEIDAHSVRGSVGAPQESFKMAFGQLLSPEVPAAFNARL